MSRWKTILTLFSVCLLSLVLSPLARASDWNKATILTFTGPVEIPGRILSAGTYQFRLFDSASNRNVVQVFDGDGMHLYATILGIPSYRDVPVDKPVITFEERPLGSPEAIKSWFYPGEYYGVEFLYPNDRALGLANATSQSSGMATSSYSPSDSGSAATSEAPAEAAGATEENQETQQATTPEAPAQQAQTQQNEAATTNATEQQEAEKLPKTASLLPLIALIGMGSLGAALTLRAVAKRRA